MDRYNPVLEFTTEAEDFALGFEAGRLYALMEAQEYATLREQPFHSANAEMVLRMIERFGLSLRAEFTPDDGWMVLVDA